MIISKHTGYITIKKSLHSLIEYDEEQYIKLTNFLELCPIKREDLIKDTVISSNLDIRIKPYLVFRDEIIKDIEKNYELFETIEYDHIKLEKKITYRK